MDVDAFLAALRADSRYAQQIVASHRLPPRPVARRELAPPPPEPLAEALDRRGIKALYSHQVEAIEHARAGRDVVIVTGTASGKTLCYNIPVIERILQRRDRRALYLFPLKALAHDQRRQIEELGLWERIRAAAYDGDTPTEERRVIRRSAQIVLSNPDMLHRAILPHHGLWSDFLSHLDFVVLDEIHTYRGVFGSHTAHVLRRLLRLCERYGSRPAFICSSATIGNAVELTQRLTGREDVAVVDENGAPRGERRIVVWNPPVLEAGTGRPLPPDAPAYSGLRRSANVEAAYLLAELLRRRVRTIAFTRSRQEAELVLRYVRAALEGEGLAERVAAYRAGYLPTERRAIERRLASGELWAVIATVALEAGVDIGGLDATVMVGYPGTVAGFWQQVGRSGRRGSASLALLITRDSLVDQYFAQHPGALWGRPTEQALIDPDNVYILGGHLLCAAHEQPLDADDIARFGAESATLLPLFEEEEWLTALDGRWFLARPQSPAMALDLRAASDERLELVDTARGETMAIEDGSRLWDTFYPGAIHLHAGEQYRVIEHEEGSRRIHLEPVSVNHFTRPMVLVDVAVDETTSTRPLGEGAASFGELTVTRQTTGYRQLSSVTFELLAMHDLEGPPQSMDTAGLWLTLSPELVRRVAELGSLEGGLNAVQNALSAALPLIAMCDVRDVQGAAFVAHADTDAPAIFLYDNYPGGIGLAERGYEALDPLLRRTVQIVATCPCEEGCPACIQSSFAFGATPLDKAAGLAILWGLAGGRS